MTRAMRAALLVALSLAPLTARADEDFRSHPPAAATRAPFTPPAIREARLANGIRVLLVERHALPIVTLRAVSSYGAANAAPGVAAFAAATATRATGAYTAWELHKALASIGAEDEARAGADGVALIVKCTSPGFEAAAELLGGMAYDAAFASDDIAQVRDRRQRERIDVARTSPSLLLASALYPAPHPLHERLWGSEATIASVSEDALRTYWKAAWVPSRTTLVIAGDVRMEAILPVLERTFGTAKAASVPPEAAMPVPAPARRARIYLANRPGLPQAKLSVGAIVASIGSPDYEPLVVATDVLRERLYADLRERRAVSYAIDVSLDAMTSHGELTIEAPVEAGHAAEALGRVFTELDRLASERLPDDYLAAVKSHAAFRLPGQLETTGGTARAVGQLALAGLPLDTWNARAGRMARVTAEDVQRVAAKYMQSSQMQVAIAGDAQRVAPQLGVQGYGEVTIAP